MHANGRRAAPYSSGVQQHTRQSARRPPTDDTAGRELARPIADGLESLPDALRVDEPEAQAEMAADVDPEALTVMASADADMAAISRSEFDDNLARTGER
jgi:hypothetical protein